MQYQAGEWLVASLSECLYCSQLITNSSSFVSRVSRQALHLERYK